MAPMTSPQVQKKLTSRDAIDAIGVGAITAELSVSVSSVKEARRGKFPASWFPSIEKLAAKSGICVDRAAFNWRNSQDDGAA